LNLLRSCLYSNKKNMRISLFFFSLLLAPCLLFSKGSESRRPYYETVSDLYHPSIKDGYFQVTGVIKNGNTENPIPDAIVTNVGMTNQSTTNEVGFFNLLLPLKDSVVYCYAMNHNEVQIKGPFKNKHNIQVRVYLTEQMAVAYKPLIYLYDAPEAVTLNLKPKGKFTFTYPVSTDGNWIIKTNADGSLTNLSDGKTYPYIFWEGEINALKIEERDHQVSGYLVKTDTCISFLENTLSAYGLNEKETTDFITFWGPKLIEKPYALVQFITAESYENNIAELSINQQPETLLRLYMYLVPLEKDVIPYKLTTPEIAPLNRSGFTVIEWGGSILNAEKNLN